MKRTLMLICCGLALIAVSAFKFSSAKTEPVSSETAMDSVISAAQQSNLDRRFEVQILVNGRPLDEYAARGTSYVEANPGAEYEVRIHNPLPYRVAVALSVDGLNSIDARHTTAWNASKWVIEPYGTISISGWQMSSARARRFYFTSERDSYGAKLGQTSNLGLISAVFFRELRPIRVPIAPPPRSYPIWDEEGRNNKQSESPAAGSSGETDRKESKSRDSAVETRNRPQSTAVQPLPDDGYAATGIGRSVQNDVRWVNLELDSRPAGAVTLRYEYYPALVKLGILPRRYYERPDPLRRREGARGFDDRRFSPEP